ncbi:putative membrane protein [Klebsiella phage vB_KpnS-VAC8]|uniref:Membrane protein n=1 Tax=Klebsiella phage vB_KpnS-VAC8 TaxID=2864366 RepID=A0AAE7XGV2_9CAUD|nr:putative membrane protein [Klebsiella phage vB_KpnS-VAC8]
MYAPCTQFTDRSQQNVRCVSPTFTSCGRWGKIEHYLKFAQKLTNISPYIDSKYMINNNIIIITLYLYICLVRFPL